MTNSVSNVSVHSIRSVTVIFLDSPLYCIDVIVKMNMGLWAGNYRHASVLYMIRSTKEINAVIAFQIIV